MRLREPALTGLPGGRRSPCWQLGVLALWLLATLGWRPLMLPDEGRYAGVAREMLRGDLLVPTLNGLPFFHKPPLFYWLDMAALQLVGDHAFGARFASLVGAWLMGMGLLLAIRHWHGERHGVLALAVLATTPFFFVGAQFANLDMLVAGLITVAVFALVRAVDDPPRLQLRWLLAGCLASALAVLAKGLIGCVLPALIVGPWLLARGRWRQVLQLLHPLGLLLFTVVAAPWFVVMQWRYPGFFDYFFMEQHVRRFAQTNFNNASPFWFFLLVLPVLTLPWSVWLVHSMRQLRVQRNPHAALYAWWVVVVVGFFSLPSSKLVGYVLPALAPLCALLGLAMAQARALRWWPWVLGASAVLCLSIVVALAVLQAPRSNQIVGQALAARIQPADRVVMVDDYFYDLPFYAGLAEPVTVASDWADPSVPLRDNWRKELFDAARFDPSRARTVLRPLAELDALACGTGTTWLVLHPADAPRVAALSGTARVLATPRTELWSARARRCP